jgi:hypothetical protein
MVVKVVRAALAWESITLFAICMVDMLSTLYWVHHNTAREANPWLANCLRQGDGVFCAAKIISFLPLLIFAAYYRPRRPRLIAVSLRVAIVLYLVIYAAAVFPSLANLLGIATQ